MPFWAPLTNDYWPDDEPRPMFRLVAAFAATPLVVALLGGSIAYAIYDATQGLGAPDENPSALAGEAFFAIWGAAVLMTLLGAGLTTPILWSLRKRGRLAYTIAGLGIGGAAIWMFHTQTGAVGEVGVSVLLAMGVLIMWIFRAIAGVREE